MRGHLGDRERGSMREPVAVSDDELLERELGVAEGAGPGLALTHEPARASPHAGRSCACSQRADVVTPGAGRSASKLAPRRGPIAVQRLSKALRARLLIDDFDGDRRFDDVGGAGLEHASEALANPRARRGRRFEQQPPAAELARAQRSEPDAVGAVVDGEGKLGLHT